MIGILGGIGPAAGADLFKKITEETCAGKDQEHLPVLLFSLPNQIADRTEFLEGTIAENPGIAMANICLQMEKAGVTVMGIPCNTAHSPVILNKIKEILTAAQSQISLVHMIDENIQFIQSLFESQTKIGVLSTTGTYRQSTYSDKIKKAGFNCIVPTEDLQKELVHNSIYHYSYGIKTNSNKISDLSKAQLYHVMDLMHEQGVKAIILACTEIPLALTTTEYRGMQLIDATRILARALIRAYDPAKLKLQAAAFQYV